MNKKIGLILLLVLSALTLIISMGIGSVSIHPLDTFNILVNKLFGLTFADIHPTIESIILDIRLPRILTAFISGGGLALSGVIMQSILKNPLASSYTLGVSAGAAVGAGIAILFRISVFGVFTLQVFGMTAGLITVFVSILLAGSIDKNLRTNSIILTGMAISLFANAILTVVMSLAREDLQRLVAFQSGSFALKTFDDARILVPFVIVGFFISIMFSRELDIMTFGDDHAISSGVNLRKIKLFLIVLATVVTGSIISIVGIIGFVDLFTPHLARKIFGANHKYVIPVSILFGGSFMVLCDLVARTILPPLELPVGAVTALVGAPVFIYIYFCRRNN